MLQCSKYFSIYTQKMDVRKSRARKAASCLSEACLDEYMELFVVMDAMTSSRHHAELVSSEDLTLVLSTLYDAHIGEASVVNFVAICANESYDKLNSPTNTSHPKMKNLLKCMSEDRSSQKCDIFGIALHCTASIEALLTRMLGKDKNRSALLKDVLHDPRLSTHLPPLVIEMCKYLFLPASLNFRNLIWHGFMTPNELDARLVSLIVILERSFRKIIASNLEHFGSERTKNFEDYRAEFSHFPSLLGPLSIEEFEKIVRASLFCLDGHQSLVVSSFRDFKQHRHLESMLKILPCLEQGLRLLFCLSNEKWEYIMAWKDAYFSTLDGFGQRSRHQLLLDFNIQVYRFKSSVLQSTVEADDLSTEPNALLMILPSGVYALLVDLFFTESGPNLRSLFAHGEYKADFSQLSAATALSVDISGLEEMVSVLMSLTITLLVTFQFNGALAKRLKTSIKESVIDSSESSERRLCALRVFNELKLKTSNFSGDDEKYGQLEILRWQSTYHMNAVICKALKSLLEIVICSTSEICKRCVVSIEHLEIMKCLDINSGHKEDVPKKGADRMIIAINLDVDHDSDITHVTIRESFARLHQCFSPSFICNLGIECDAINGNGSDMLWYAKDFIVSLCMDRMVRLTEKTFGHFNSKLRDWNSIVSELVSALPCSTTHRSRDILIRWTLLIRSVVDDVLGFMSDSKETIMQRFVPIPLYSACLQLIEDLSLTLSSLSSVILQKEHLVLTGASHSTDRKQFVTHLTCTAPATLCLASLVLQILLMHTWNNTNREIASRTDFSSADLSGYIRVLSSLVPSVSGCLPQVSPDGKPSTGGDKKPVEKVMKNVISCLASKAFSIP